ncbi:MAG: cytochrome c biogenesis CcdA family protein [Rhizobiaceae bacterium]
MDIPVYYALLAGAISFLSPCVLPLVPPYLCYMAGSSMRELTTPSGTVTHSSVRKRVMLSSVLFVLGFSVVFVSLGASASTVGTKLREIQLGLSDFLASNLSFLPQFVIFNPLSALAGIIIIVMGLHFLGVFRIGLLYKEARFQTSGTGPSGAFVMGLAFAFGWTPCIGPILAVILSAAATREDAGAGAFMLAVYSAGLGIPFLLAAMFIDPFMNFLARFKKHLGLVEKIMGGMLVLTGIVFISGHLQMFNTWMIELFPLLSQIG